MCILDYCNTHIKYIYKSWSIIGSETSQIFCWVILVFGSCIFNTRIEPVTLQPPIPNFLIFLLA